MRPYDRKRSGQRWTVGAAAVVAFAVIGCADDSPTSTNDLRGTVITNDANLPNDPITIDSARVAGETLVAYVSHGGGCSEHTFQLVIGTAWMESFPVQVSARIAHNANGDICKALLRRELRMGLRPLAEAYRAAYKQEHGTVAIQLAGSSARLLFVF